MTVDEVRERVRLQAASVDGITNDHRIILKQALIPPQKIAILVGEEDSSHDYKIIMREDGLQFDLASKGFPSDPFLILTGWYGSLKSTFLAM